MGVNTLLAPPPVEPRLSWFHVIFSGLVLVANAIAVSVACQDRSWGALAIAVAAGPAMNGIFAAVGLAAYPFLRRLEQRPPLGWHLLIALALPSAAIALDYFAILYMDLSGC